MRCSASSSTGSGGRTTKRRPRRRHGEDDGADHARGTPPPAPAITDHPPTTSNSNTGTFSFTDSQPGVTFQCTVDRVSSTCTSPFTSGVLADGSHTFTVWALDPAGDVSSGTSYTWTSDTTPPPPPTFSGTHPGKLVTIVLENESHPAIVGNPNAPYLNQLIANGEEFTNYFAVDTTGSFPNYLAMTSGNSSATALSPNIFRAIDATGGALTWKEFMESMQGNCAQGTSGTVPGTTNTLYTADHDPGLQYSPNISCAANDVPMNASTFDPAHLPDFSYVVPNECDDMHTFPTSGQACPAFYGPNTGTDIVNMSDNWLAHVVPHVAGPAQRDRADHLGRGRGRSGRAHHHAARRRRRHAGLDRRHAVRPLQPRGRPVQVLRPRRGPRHGRDGDAACRSRGSVATCPATPATTPSRPSSSRIPKRRPRSSAGSTTRPSPPARAPTRPRC